MGKIKGWKKILDSKSEIQWKNDITTDVFVVYKSKNKWSANILEHGNLYRQRTIFSTLPKSKILTYAIKWMKAHPRG